MNEINANNIREYLELEFLFFVISLKTSLREIGVTSLIM
jgi:hypothetical protein